MEPVPTAKRAPNLKMQKRRAPDGQVPLLAYSASRMLAYLFPPHAPGHVQAWREQVEWVLTARVVQIIARQREKFVCLVADRVG